MWKIKFELCKLKFVHRLIACGRPPPRSDFVLLFFWQTVCSMCNQIDKHSGKFSEQLTTKDRGKRDRLPAAGLHLNILRVDLLLPTLCHWPTVCQGNLICHSLFPSLPKVCLALFFVCCCWCLKWTPVCTCSVHRCCSVRHNCPS